MKLAIITHVAHIPKGSTYFGYSAYVREMNLWGKFASQLLIAAPKIQEEVSKIHLSYDHEQISLTHIPQISFTSLGQGIRSLVIWPWIAFRMWQVMRRADHIHLRCPGTLGLIGCLVQVCFPKKSKTAKYAGNWDPKAQQPFSYRLQKWLLSNTFLTKNMQVLVYGEWPNQSKNILPFFTATYRNEKIETLQARNFDAPLRFLFAGNLTTGKRPEYVMELVARLVQSGISCTLDFYGDGVQMDKLKERMLALQASGWVTLHGNETAEVVEKAYRSSHFLVLPSKSEGWPKVVAEAMFWGCIPVATSISCVPWMLGDGDRGVLLDLDLEADAKQLSQLVSNKERLRKLSKEAQDWSKAYTLDRFEDEIKKLLS
ncbi:MAG: glycosyltransferase [Bacteroidota bacterium]